MLPSELISEVEASSDGFVYGSSPSVSISDESSVEGVA